MQITISNPQGNKVRATCDALILHDCHSKRIREILGMSEDDNRTAVSQLGAVLWFVRKRNGDIYLYGSETEISEWESDCLQRELTHA